MRITDYLRSAQASINRQPGRAVLTVTALSLSALIVMSLTAVSLGIHDAARQTLAPDSSMSTVVVTPTHAAASAGLFGGAQEVSQGSDKLTTDMLTDFTKLPHVVSAVPLAEVWEFKTFQLSGGSGTFVAQAAGAPADLARTRPLSAGAYYADEAKNQVVLGYGYARELGARPDQLIGKQIDITTQNGYIGTGADILLPTASAKQAEDYANRGTILHATVVGVLKPGLDESRMYLPLQWARQIRTLRSYQTDQGRLTEKRVDQIDRDGYSSILVQADSPQNIQPIINKAREEGVGALSAVDELKKLEQFATVIWIGLGAIALVTLLVGALGIVNTMLSAVAEQRYTIGIWRAHGASRGLISRLYLLQALLLGLFGGVIGALGSWGVVMFTDKALDIALQAQHLPVTTVTVFPLWLALAGVGVTMLFAMLAGAYPARRAARQEIVQILREN
jgi:ABC-type antimicrobial peptide transport system permease subunit